MTKQETTVVASHKGLYVALAAAQAEMGRALKDSKNPHFKSTYADLASVCDACTGVCANEIVESWLRALAAREGE